jgi:hypothetical protein
MDNKRRADLQKTPDERTVRETLAHLAELKQRYAREPVRLSPEAVRKVSKGPRDGQNVA